MLRSLVLAALAASLLALAPPVARACSCTEPPPPREALAAAAAVFEGQVLEIVEAGPMRVRVRFRVTQHWKGVESEELTLLPAPDSPACGVPFAVGESWLVYGDGSEGGLSASLCSRTVRMSEAGEDVAALGAGITPVDIRPEDEPEEDEDARPVAPPAERGGCQSCALVGPGSSRGGLVALPLLALVLPRLSGRRRRAAGARR